MVGVMNFTPAEVRSMSLAECYAAMDGLNDYNSAQDPKNDVPTREELEEMMRLYPDT